jgi:WD40 repeat protein
LKTWDADTGDLLHTIVGHLASVNDCAFSSDGKLIVSASDDQTLKVWNAINGDCLTTFYADGPLFCCTMHDEMIVAGGARGIYFLRLIR